jgi:hypothetical protein
VTEAKATSQTVVTPSGIEILYQWEPKRLYRARSPERPDGSHNYDWREVPSVTKVLEVLDKPALVSWGETIGVDAVLKLVQLGLLHEAKAGASPTRTVLARQDESGQWVVASVDQTKDLMTSQQLRTYQVKEQASDRGNAVHDALEAWAKTASLPDVSIYPEEQLPYVVGLRNFLEAAQPEPLASEVMVGSITHGFAGRYDVRWRIPKECQVVHHVTPKRGPQFATLKPGVLLTDLKSSKDYYELTHPRQLEAYEEASIECGYDPTDARGVLVVGGYIKNPDTKKWEQRPPYYKFVRSTAVFEDFRVVLDVWRSNQAIKERKR